jgi:hypothetical protein
LERQKTKDRRKRARDRRGEGEEIQRGRYIREETERKTGTKRQKGHMQEETREKIAGNRGGRDRGKDKRKRDTGE